jgi:hypothetical protein
MNQRSAATAEFAGHASRHRRTRSSTAYGAAIVAAHTA